MHREIKGDDVTQALREWPAAYDCHFAGKKRILSSDNRCFWNQKTNASEA